MWQTYPLLKGHTAHAPLAIDRSEIIRNLLLVNLGVVSVKNKDWLDKTITIGIWRSRSGDWSVVG